MKNSFAIAFLLSFSLACSQQQHDAKKVPTAEATPQTLSPKKANLDLNNYSKRSSYNIIDELFAEAIENDPQLLSLVNRIDLIGNERQDSLASYYNYMSNNQNYWRSLSGYIGLLSDSTLREEMQKLMQGLEKQQIERTNSLDSLENQIALSEKVVRDQKILMTIMVTQTMMHNYQVNELPSLAPLKGIKEKCEALTEESKTYTK